MKHFSSTEIARFVSGPAFERKVCVYPDESLPKISIVTPSYNQGQFLERTILSVLNQGYPNLEYIIMDGGSTDGSVEIIKRYEKHLSHWVSEKDDGQGDAIRKGFNLCTGQVLAYLNSDDTYLPGALRRVGCLFRDRPDVDIVYGNNYLTDEKDHIVGDRRFTPYIRSVSRWGFLYGGFGICQPTAFWKRDLYYKVGQLDPTFIHCMDTDLFVKFALHRTRFRFLREYLACARIHRSSKTSTLRHVARREGRMIEAASRRYKSRVVSLSCRTLVRAVRIAVHLAQGDGVYLLKRKLPGEFTWVP